MREVFADALYWVALVNPSDQWRERALAAGGLLGDARILTTEEVLVEFLNAFAEAGAHVRTRAVSLVESIRIDPGTVLIPQTTLSFERGLILYRNRLDKGYSLTDCISMKRCGSVELPRF